MVPRLRFPEFRDAGEWVEKLFSDVYSFHTTNSLSRENLSYDGGQIRNVHYGDIHTKFPTLFDLKKESVPFINPTLSIEKIRNDSYCLEGDMIFADASEDLEDIGKSIEIVSLNNEKLVSGLHTLLARQKEQKLIVGFGGYLFKSNWIRSQIKREAQGAKVLGISVGRLSNIKIHYPSKKSEQQKIADCLSSLDDLIAAESQKLDALKVHKKGMMQQLFPAEGETVPRLRFAEFRGVYTGEWVEKDFSSYIKLYRGSSPRPIQEYLTQSESGVNWIKIGDTKFSENYIIYKIEEKITPEGAEKSRKVEVGELILANSMSFGKTYQLAIEGYIYDGWFVLREYEKHFYKPFLLHLLNSEYMQKQYQKLSAGGIVQNISSEIVYNTMLFHTSVEEQKRIADCLSSLDDLIAAQSQKLEALKVHKKGLMQQLFPNPNEIEE